MSTPASVCHRGMLFSPEAEDRFSCVPDGCLVVDGQGRIADALPYEQAQERYPDAIVTDWRPAAILPGLVDVHSHIPQYSAVAMDGYELLPWLERFIYPAEARFADPEHAYDRSWRFFRAALARGTTATALYVTVHEEATRMAFRAADRAGIRAFLGKVMMDRNAPAALQENTAASLSASERLCAEWHGAADGRLGYAFSPRFAVTCTDELMSTVARLAEECGALVQTHLAENPSELQAVADLFPGAGSYTDVYARAGLLGPRTLMAHCLYLSGAEWDMLAQTQTRVAHCPSSNFFLRSGVMDIQEARDRGVTVGLGSDVGAGPTLSIFEEMSHACFASRARVALEKETVARMEGLRVEFGVLRGGEALYGKVMDRLDLADRAWYVDPTHAFYMATMGGAEALGIGDTVGSLEPGKSADFVVVDLREVDPYQGEEERTSDEVLSQLIFRTEPRAVAATYVRGEARHMAPARR